MGKRIVLAFVFTVSCFGLLEQSDAATGCEVRTSLFSVPNLTVLGVPVCDINGAQWMSLATAIKGEDFANDLLKVAPQARSLGGATLKRYISVGVTEDEHAICTAACTLYSITVTNTNAAARHIKCDDAAAIATTVPGTSVPELDLAVPGATTGAGLTFPFPVGAAFVNGLNCWIVTGAAESDVAEVAANELKVLYTFKQ